MYDKEEREDHSEEAKESPIKPLFKYERIRSPISTNAQNKIVS
jgi:hypothetical protein